MLTTGLLFDRMIQYSQSALSSAVSWRLCIDSPELLIVHAIQLGSNWVRKVEEVPSIIVLLSTRTAVTRVHVCFTDDRKSDGRWRWHALFRNCHFLRAPSLLLKMIRRTQYWIYGQTLKSIVFPPSLLLLLLLVCRNFSVHNASKKYSS